MRSVSAGQWPDFTERSELTEDNREAFQKQLAVVFQDAMIMSVTIAENISGKKSGSHGLRKGDRGIEAGESLGEGQPSAAAGENLSWKRSEHGRNSAFREARFSG